MWKLKRDKILSKKKKKEVHKVLEVKQVCFATVYVELFFFFYFLQKLIGMPFNLRMTWFVLEIRVTKYGI